VAERTLLTAIAVDLSLADILLAAETERAFADTGHSLDFINKAFECLDLIGWENAAALLPAVVGQMVAASVRRGVDRVASACRSYCAVRQSNRSITGIRRRIRPPVLRRKRVTRGEAADGRADPQAARSP
jgi:hypothetical protein